VSTKKKPKKLMMTLDEHAAEVMRIERLYTAHVDTLRSQIEFQRKMLAQQQWPAAGETHYCNICPVTHPRWYHRLCKGRR